ncbi:gasdermin-A [Rhinatrema bivittatum]|uniref:gasdermin-A n=1 Tax=Rhinatrema bivittatum TaxID=194408 RepID=UPI0011262297|nr:gasdermin-A [Rhinatrema bivittatum]
MGSVFGTMAKSIVSQLDPDGDLTPASSVIHSDRFKPLSLLWRRTLGLPLPWRKQKYRSTGFKLTEVMEAGDAGEEIEILRLEQFKVTDQVDGTLVLNVEVPDPVINVEVKGAAEISQTRSTHVNKMKVTQATLETLKDNRRINMNHTLIRELKETLQDLYVVTETIEAVQDTTINISSSLEGSLSLFFSKVGIKSKARQKKSITIPKGSVLGFRVQLLKIQEGEWVVSHVPRKKEQTFQSDYLRILENFQEGFPAVMAQIEKECVEFTLLSPEVAEQFLAAFLLLIKDPKTSADVESRLEQSLYCSARESKAHPEPSIARLLGYLGLSSRPVVIPLVRAVLFFLDAVSELDEDGTSLLVESVERQDTGQQLKRVQKVLEEELFSVRQGSLAGDEAAGGVSPEGWSPAVQSCAMALYAALYALHVLSSC